jgi:hypothetical protein
MPGSQQSLEEFVRSRPWKGGSGTAWCCTQIPKELRDQVDAYIARCREQHISPRWRAIVAWLTEQGIEGATVPKLQYHEDHVLEAKR